MPPKLIPIVLLTLLLPACCPPTDTRPGIQQIIETRNGQHSVWGVIITLHDSSFSPTFSAGDMQIVEEKHDRDITDGMSWSINKSRSKLSIQFKPGDGDFGSGNTITIQIKRSALQNYNVANRPQWTISTDPT